MKIYKLLKKSMYTCSLWVACDPFPIDCDIKEDVSQIFEQPKIDY